MANVVVVILTLNQRQRTLQCLASLVVSQQEPPFHILVWDNGSQDGTVAAVQETFPQVMTHYHPCNLGVASGRNAAAKLAIKAFKPTHLLFLDNDMLFEAGFVRALLKPFNDDQVGQTQAKLRFMHDHDRLNDGGGAQINFLLWQITPVGFNEIDHGQHDTIKNCIACGGAMMVRADVFQQLGGFDSSFDPFGPEDLDFSLRLQQAGYLALYVPQAVAYHVVSHTFGEGYSEEYARHKLQHWILFFRRHASIRQKLAFFCAGAPYMAVRVIIREARKGNLGALRGFVRGVFDFFKVSVFGTE